MKIYNIGEAQKELILGLSMPSNNRDMPYKTISMMLGTEVAMEVGMR